MKDYRLIKNKGYWSVDGQHFDNKVNAILAAQEKNIGIKDIQYHYNDYYWDQVDWSKEPEKTLDELYLEQAKRLRAKYKTLILRFSGGGDSTNILHTFLDNDIPIDVVAINMWMQPGVDPRVQPSNVEKFDIAIPYLNQLISNGAKFKLIINDFSPTLSIIKDDPNWIFKYDAPRFSIPDLCLSRGLNTAEFDEYNNSDTCIITGVDKPQVWCRHDKIWYFCIEDRLHDIVQPVNQMIQEPFYWTADMPEIPIKQSHVIKNFWSQHVDKMEIVGDDATKKSQWRKTHLYPLIYPKYYSHIDIFSNHLPTYDMTDVATATKNGNGNAPKGTGLDFAIEQSEFYDVWKQGIDLADSLIDQCYKSKDSIWTNGLICCEGKRRWLGRA